MNSAYHPPDMSQRLPGPGPGYSSSLPPPIHAYQQHQHPPPSLPPPSQLHHSSHPPPPPPPSTQHPHHQHPPQPPPPPPSSSHSLSSHQHHPQPPHHQSQHPPYPPISYQQPHPSQYTRPQPHQQLPPPSRHDEPPPPSSEASPNDQPVDPQYEPQSFSKVEEGSGLKYSLEVQQQPIRARMCGFGDKDRRPITPPPCVRLVIFDTNTGKEVDYVNLDHSMFVLSVDLWDRHGAKEVNLVRSSTGTGAMASSNSYSYSTLEPGTPSSYQQQSLPPSRESGYGQTQGMGYGQDYPPPAQQSYGQAPSYPSSSSYGPPQQYFPRHSGYSADPPAPPPGAPFRSGYSQDQNALTRMAVVGGQPQGMFTRNLIGSLAASAFRLNDTERKPGIWFVLQDLSVRTEGNFRLRFSFVNVGRPGGPGGPGANVNQGRAPILSSCFSKEFSVYSAKKFPGVCESTPLSKTFAGQGIKIPIRKDTNIKGEGDEDMYDQN
ncbi:Ff.00g099030.m01.CDS01 [Fusarium sp. VM40]|nr:Ff.00g099030.m01.CDS01 [Fusarium sp. VM40]